MRKRWKIKILDGRPIIPDEISDKCRLIVFEFVEPVSIKDVLRNLYDQESEPIDIPGCTICRSGPSWEVVVKSMLRRFAKILTEEDKATRIVEELDADDPTDQTT